MNYDEHTTTVTAETGRLVDAFAALELNAPVPTCPEWRALDLATHVGQFTGFWTHALCEGTGRPKPAYSEPPAGTGVTGGDIADWYAALSAALVAELRQTPAATAVWTWVDSDKTARFVARRCANELAIHRFDAQRAVGRAVALEPDVAADAVDEIFVMIAARDDPHEGSGRTLCLAPSDLERRWVITLAPTGPVLGQDTDGAQLTLTGEMSDLALTLFRRPALGSVGQHGDGAVLEAWYREFIFG
jgi:uncharacterized protein (TIGR03083 family)